MHSLFDLNNLKAGLPEVPEQKRKKLKERYFIKDEDIETYINNRETLGHFFENVAPILDSKEKWQTLSNFLTSDVMGIVKTKGGFDKIHIPCNKCAADLVEMFVDGRISSRTAKDMIAVMLEREIIPEEYAEEHGLLQSNDTEGLKILAQKILDENPDVVATYKGGKENAIMALVGKVIKESNGSANPQLAIETLKELLK